MADETTTVILNPRPIEAPEPPKPGVMGGTVGPKEYSGETELEALKRRIEALERAVNGKVSK